MCKAKSLVLGAAGVGLEDGEEETVPADIIVLANGFDIGNWFHPLSVVGREGRKIQDVWKERNGPQAYQGTAMDGFPNFFILFGPNTATGHSSVILAIENMVTYSLQFIRKILDADVELVEVKKEAEIEWTRQVQSEIQKSVFNRGGCTSWYIREGWNSTAYPWSQFHFGYRCWFPKWRDWNIKYTRKGHVKRISWKIGQLAFLGFVATTLYLKW